ncbi:MAG: cytochrome c oxidase subunit II [Oscillatoriales cyanobacterium RM2_1_1]|nr:cytochrome c oxidase subunit II [Oscillatoriales cyanobacterium SM2_3_0]NJO45883.1 cytochrome c oxidase subunit II [Oscillatoriales cyanobacterium RM2_1_1]
MNIPSSILTLIFGIIITLISLWYGQNSGILPIAASAEASEVDTLFKAMLTISFGLVLLVEGILVVCLIHFRRRAGDNSDGPPIHGNIPLEIFWTAIPALTVLAIGMYSFEIYNQMGGLDPMVSGSQAMAHHHHSGTAIAASLSDSDELRATSHSQPTQIALGIGAAPAQQGKLADVVVDVNGMQYAWIFNYQENGIIAGELHVPVNQDVQLNINAQDVLHAFWLPELRLKQDAIPGRTTELRFRPTRVGTYPVVCAELCGGYHGAMRTQMVVETPEEYGAWVQENMIAARPESQDVVALMDSLDPAQLTDAAFLAPYETAMGIKPELIAQLQSPIQPQNPIDR